MSTPRMLASLVEEAVSVGDLVRLMSFRKGQANLVEITLPDDTPWGGKAVKRLDLPRDAALVTILRGARVIVPEDDEPSRAVTNCCSSPSTKSKRNCASSCCTHADSFSRTRRAPAVASPGRGIEPTPPVRRGPSRTAGC